MNQFCTNCGAKIEGDSKFCQGCGEKRGDAWQQPGQTPTEQIQPNQQQIQQPPQLQYQQYQPPQYMPAPVKKKSKAPLIAGILVLVAVVAAAVLFVPKIIESVGNSVSNKDNKDDKDAKNNNTGNGLSGLLGDGLSGLLGGDGLSGMLSGLEEYNDQDNENNTVNQTGDGLPGIGLDGIIGQYGGSWPENDLAKQVPKPDFDFMVGEINDSEFSVLFQGAAIEQVKSYAEKVKAAGFTFDAFTEDENMMGMPIYNYEAKNAAGYKVEVFSAMGMAGMTIKIP